MTLHTHPAPSRSVSGPTRLVRRFVAARERHQEADLRRRAAWVEQARHAPTLQSWIDAYGEPVDGPARRTRTVIARRR
jgi:hypothetical protein